MRFEGSAGLWIRQQRDKLDLTQKELANEVGCSIIMIRKIEGDERRPSKQMARKIAEILRVPATEISVFLEFVRITGYKGHAVKVEPPVNISPNFRVLAKTKIKTQ